MSSLAEHLRLARAHEFVRLFVAIEINEAWAAQIVALQSFVTERGLAQAGVLRDRRIEVGALRIVPPAQLHLTLAFLGDFPTSDLELLQLALGERCAALQPFSLHPTNLGTFPPRGTPRVVWLGVASQPSFRLEELFRAVRDGCGEVGIPLEDRPFTPHITFARCGRPSRPRAGKRREAAQEDSQDTTVSEHTTPHGRSAPLIDRRLALEVSAVTLFWSQLPKNRGEEVLHLPLARFALQSNGANISPDSVGSEGRE